MNLVVGTPLAELSYDHEKVTAADSSSKVLFRAVTIIGVPSMHTCNSKNQDEIKKNR